MSQDTSLNDEDEIAFLSEIRSNPLLEREEAYLKINQELERKTSDLILRFEKYSKSRSHCSSSAYERRDSASEFGTDDGISSCGDEASEGGFSISSRKYKNQVRSSQNQNLETSKSNSSSSLFEKMALLSSLSPEESIEKKPSRLQRATESVIKSLHAKLLNHEERLADLHLQYRHKIQENTILESKIKALEEERERFLRTIANLQGTVEKHAKDAESSKSNLSLKTQTVVCMKKELNEYKRTSKLTNANGQTLQTRLNRSLEDNERLKNQNRSLGFHLKELQSECKANTEACRLSIQDLEKQKISLNLTVKKQSQLIKSLRDKKVNTG